MLEALKSILVGFLFCLALAGTTLNSRAAEEPLLTAGPASEPVLLTDGSEEEIFSSGENPAVVELLPVEIERREYWRGEPMEFDWVTFDSLNQLQLFTLADANDAGGFIYGKWVSPGFVLYRASGADATNYLGWCVDYDAEDERIRPHLSAEDDSTLYWNFPDSWKQLAMIDKQIDEYLAVICSDLDDLWWFYENIKGDENDIFQRPHTMIQGIVKDIQDMETRIQDKLIEWNSCYSDALMKLHPERYEEE